MMADGKGLLAADESASSAGKRLNAVDVESTEENRRLYRELFFAVDGIEAYLSGVILNEETFPQSANDGTPYVKLLEDKGIVPGIKVDKSTHDFPGFPEEVITEGLDGLPARMEEYRDGGARFAKWRGVIRIGDGIPTDECIDTNATLLARYSRICQEADIVPMVEPEVLLSGSHSAETAEQVTQKTVEAVMRELSRYRVDLSGVILKTSMVVPGDESGEKATHDDVADRTLRMLHEVVSHELGGIVFLSGGQSPEDATANLNAINGRGDQPWGLTFSYARAIQGPALEIWRGADRKMDEAREAYMKRLKLNSLARKAVYSPDMEDGSV